jgi:tRNA modification GTPase
LERVLARALQVPGVRHAEPGEFTARAYLNGKLTLEQAEGVAATVAARTDEQLASARDLLAGTAGARYRGWADELTTLLALVEAGIDFTDQEDVRAIEPGDLALRLERVRDQLRSFLGAAGGTERAHALPRVVLFGAPNAGKSTLFNALLGRRRAVVSGVAGTTRDVLAEELDLSRDAPGSGCVLLTDLAGLDESDVGGTAAEAQTRARTALAGADVIVHCDPAGDFGALDAGALVIRVRTKADVPAHRVDSEDALAVCALDGWNLGALRRAIADAAWSRRAAGLAALLPRHRRAIESMESSVGAGMDLARGADAAELAGHLRMALDAAGELVGRIAPDDILGRVFATFCVGK